MNIEDVLEHYRSMYRAAKVLHLSINGMKNWKRAGFIPYHYQLLIEHRSNGALRAIEDPIKSKDEE